MKRSTQLLWFAALVAIFIVFYWLDRHRTSSPDEAPRSDPAPVATEEPAVTDPSLATPAAAEPLAVKPADAPYSELPRWDAPLDQAAPRLRELGDAGDTWALLELANRLHACTPAEQRRSAASDEQDRRSIEEDAKDERWTEAQRTNRRRNAQWRIDRNAAVRAGCEKTDADLRANWLDPLDRAAQAGNTAAMRQYAKSAIEPYDAVNADDAIARRDKARAYLLEAVRRGDAGSLADLAQAYSADAADAPRLYPPDPVQSYLYAYAGSLARGLTPVLYGNLDAIMAESAKSLDARQLAEAQTRGRRTYEQCCSAR
ncbi:hypothetical protein [Dokdonella sp.]|uniref:hypothetical protein n=1 Tax=Dokdonella sp. TaxID=2291710 RepID=UPI001B2AA9B2|nr:hypothetical protein [Dokdonella sp.]MBO9661326.1 hypothetical protein [Dokdonella sp.]